ncbi:MAG: CHASE2 domain-containing protein [Gemmatimonadota bacterium]
MKSRVRLLLAGVAVLAPAMAIIVAETRGGRSLERRIYDGWFTLRGSLTTPAEVAVVAIDVESENSLGRYPWSREWHAQLLRNLHRAGARVVAFDATFADEFPDDSILRGAIDETGIAILGAKTSVLYQRGARGFSLELPAPALRGAPIGIVDINPDPLDAVIRTYPVLHHYPDGSTVPQLGVQALLNYLKLPADSLRSVKDGWQLGSRFIPRGPSGEMLIAYLGMPGTVATYSYASVIDDAETDIGEWDMDAFEDLLAEERFKDRIVFIGSTVPEHHDLLATPYRDSDAGAGTLLMSGVEIHAQAVSAILDNQFINALPRSINYIWTVLLAILIVTLPAKMRGLRSGAAMLFGILAAGAAWWLFTSRGVWLWTVAPVMSIGLSYAGTTAVLFIAEAKDKARIRGMFSQYLAPSVVNELIKRPELMALGGEERIASMLFSDIVSFSTFSEKLRPTELVALLNEYLTVMSDIVMQNGGIIDKFLGDGVMAEFGVPIPTDDHAYRACRTGLMMQKELVRLRAGWAQRGMPQLHIRIGVNTGPVLVGNLGSAQKTDYTVMGDHVNLASRLEGSNKAYGTSILVSEFTWSAAREQLIGRVIDRIRVVGRSEPVAVFEVLAERAAGGPELRDLVTRFELALLLYRQKKFDDALEAFVNLAERFPLDKPTAVYVDRCRSYVEQPPSVEWDGVYALSSK